MGRPTLYTDEILEEICERLSTGETLADICRSDHMPQYRTVMEWQEKKDNVSAHIGRAREIGYDVIASRTRQTARGAGDSTDDVQRDKLIIETDLKLLAKWSKRYSDRISQEVSGPEGAPVKTDMSLSVVFVKPEARE